MLKKWREENVLISFLLFQWSGRSHWQKSNFQLLARGRILLLAWLLYLWCFLFGLFLFSPSVHKTSSLYLSPPAPKIVAWPSLLIFGATASHWQHWFLLFFFLTSDRMSAWSRCVATRLYTLYVTANESTSGWEFYYLFLNPHKNYLTHNWGINPKFNVITRLGFELSYYDVAV